MFYQLKAIRKNSKPPIWRRIAVPSNITFAQLAAILERILEYKSVDFFEFEFYTSKMRMSEWREEAQFASDFYYSYLNAPDTFINKWMEKEKAFTFRVKGEETEFPDYRIEIEKCLKNLSLKEKEGLTLVDYPVILKQVSRDDDPYWMNPNEINREMHQSLSIRSGEAEYQYLFEIREQINRGDGITVCETMVDRDIHSKKSGNALLREFSEELLKCAEKNVQKVERSDDHQGYTPIPKSYPTKRECKLDAFLKSYDKKDLLELMEEFEIKCQTKRKDKMAYEIARYLLEPSTMKARLLHLNEEELRAFEAVMDRGPFVPSEKEWDMLLTVYNLDYLCSYADNTVQVPDEVIFLYQNLLRKGYREYHKNVSWILTCILGADILYRSTPLEVLYQIYLKNPTANLDYDAFCELLKTIPENVSKCVLLKDKLINIELYETGLYRKLEAVRRGDFYIPDQREIEILVKEEYPSNEAPYQSLKKFLCRQMGCSEDFSEYLCGLAFYVFSRGGSLQEFMGYVNNMEMSFESKEQAEGFASIMVEVYNNSRRAELKGHSPNEMRAAGQALSRPEKRSLPKMKEKKVYPNDPCPCGSGKKYKKCCGNKY